MSFDEEQPADEAFFVVSDFVCSTYLRVLLVWGSKWTPPRKKIHKKCLDQFINSPVTHFPYVLVIPSCVFVCIFYLPFCLVNLKIKFFLFCLTSILEIACLTWCDACPVSVCAESNLIWQAHENSPKFLPAQHRASNDTNRNTTPVVALLAFLLLSLPLLLLLLFVMVVPLLLSPCPFVLLARFAARRFFFPLTRHACCIFFLYSFFLFLLFFLSLCRALRTAPPGLSNPPSTALCSSTSWPSTPTLAREWQFPPKPRRFIFFGCSSGWGKRSPVFRTVLNRKLVQVRSFVPPEFF